MEKMKEQGSESPSELPAIDQTVSNLAEPLNGHMADGLNNPEQQQTVEHQKIPAEPLQLMAAAMQINDSRVISRGPAEKGSDASATQDGAAIKVLLPSFANQTNKDLAAEIQQLEKDVDGTDRELDQNMQRISLMSNHLRSLQLEIDSTESRLEAKHKEVKTEQDLQKLNHFEQVEYTTLL